MSQLNPNSFNTGNELSAEFQDNVSDDERQEGAERIQIRRNIDGEYEVPSLNSKGELDIYFTDDKEDAIGTAKMIHKGTEITCVIRRGTYQ